MSELRTFVNRLYIVDKRRGSIPLGPNMTPAQDRLLTSVEDSIAAGRPVRKVVSKARQMGFSTMTEAILFAQSFMHQNMRTLVVSHRSDSNAHLLQMSRHYWETFFAKSAYTARYLAANRMGWRETNSTMHVATAASGAAGRGSTFHNIHLSECAFYDHPEELMMNLNQSMPRAPLTIQVLESTSNGVGNWWHETCRDAKDHSSNYDLLFFGWWEHPDYCASAIGEGEKLRDLFVYADDEERTLHRFLRAKGLSPHDICDKLLWRREIIATECLGDVEKFHQEYPTTLEESFVASGKNVFHIDYLRAAYSPETGSTGELVRDGDRLKFIESPNGNLRVFRKPSPDHSYGIYALGGDPAWTATGDYGTIQVLNRLTWEQVAVYRRKTDAYSLGETMNLVGRWYNEALVAPERTKGGAAAVGALQALQYPNLFMYEKTGSIKGVIDGQYGWPTNMQTKPEAIGLLQKALFDRYTGRYSDFGIRIHDETTFNELKEYVTLDNGQFGNSRGENHDDCVMALAIALSATVKYQAHLMGETGSAEPNWRGRAVTRDFTAAESMMDQLGVGGAAVMEDGHRYRPAPTHTAPDLQTAFFDEKEH